MERFMVAKSTRPLRPRRPAHDGECPLRTARLQHRYRVVSPPEGMNARSRNAVDFAVDGSNGDRNVVIRKVKSMFATINTDVAKRCLGMPPHPHLVRPLDVFSSECLTYFVTEQIIPDDPAADPRLIKESINEWREVDPTMARLHFQQLISAVRHCHRHGLSFLEPRESTVLLGPGTSGVKLCLSYKPLMKNLGLDPQALAGSLIHNHVAPEVITVHGGKDERSDMWSCGILLYTMAFGRSPYGDSNFLELVGQMAKGDIAIPPGDWDPGLVDLVLGLLSRDPETRMTMDDVLQHPWFAEGFDPAILC